MIRLIPLLICFLYACSKSGDDPASSRSPGDILTNGTWYLTKKREVRTDTFNQVLSDTTIFISGCHKDQPLVLLKDSSAWKDFFCDLTSSSKKTGSWHLSKDSIMYVYIPVTRCSFSTGCIELNWGFDPSKLIEIDQNSFTIKQQRKWFYPPEIIIEYYTYTKK